MDLEYSIRLVVAWLLWLVPLGVLGVAGYLALSVPLRRQERARLFLDVVEGGLRRGRGMEETIMSAARSGDTTLGVRFHLLAAHLELGRRLGEGLGRVPRLLPPRVVALLRVGEEMGEPARVMAACRRLVPDARSEAEGALSYVVAVGLLLLPAVPLVLMTLAVFVFPKIRQILGDYAMVPASGLVEWVLGGGRGMAVVCGVLAGVVYVALAGYLAGPRLRALWPSWGDQLDWWLPWRRLRLQRDAAGLLGDLLDAGVGEERAVVLAARGTANGVMEERAGRVTAALAAGEKLPVAVRWLDDSGELAWRLENARHSPGGFRRALAGWVESLDARAFQREQAMVHLLTTGLVVFNGVVIGVVVTGVFQVLITIVEAALLW